MEPLPMPLKEVDRVEVLTLMDNFVDVLLENTAVVKRPPKAIGEEIPTDTLLAEHGLCLLVKVQQGAEKHTIMLDTGYNSMSVLHNMDILAVDPNELEAIVLSHAHMDHTGALHAILGKISKPIPLVVHPDAFLYPRFLEEKDGSKKRFPRTLVRNDFEQRNVKIHESKAPTPILDGAILVTGEVERTTAFEKGMPGALVERDGSLEPDPIKDDQSLVINLKEKGLVIITGCSHAGIVNTILYAKKLTGIEKVYAVLGGFHLSGAFFEKILEKTIDELKALSPAVVVPMHCTGRKAMELLSREFPASFVLNSVGSKITLN
ncbi:MAG: MBL fold metallo-hydrolase [Desulfobacterales bacterium]|jgi:7,8-dihydropterin-6-yl-methyl-4-(beta-D-ribofuranosyl)aminobenzene 5'-phosphate synthase